MYWYRARFKNDYGRRATTSYQARSINHARSIAEKQNRRYSRKYKADSVVVNVKRIASPKRRPSKAKRAFTPFEEHVAGGISILPLFF